jgi:hypothetical protein
MFSPDPTRLALEAMRLAQPFCTRLARHDQKLADRLRSALLRIYLDVVSAGAPRSRADRYRRIALLETEVFNAAAALEQASAFGLITLPDAERMLELLDAIDDAFRATLIDRAS